MYSLILSPKNNLKVQILTNVRAGLEMSGPGRAFDKCQGRAGRPGSLRVAGRGSLVADFTRVAGRGARFGDPPRPCQPGSFVSSTRGCGSCDRAFRRRRRRSWARAARGPVSASRPGSGRGGWVGKAAAAAEARVAAAWVGLPRRRKSKRAPWSAPPPPPPRVAASGLRRHREGGAGGSAAAAAAAPQGAMISGPSPRPSTASNADGVTFKANS